MKKLILTFILILIFALSPAIIWFLEPEEDFKVSILDKTAPDENYREHQSITWLLNHYQYVKEDGSRYDAADDFYGFLPDEEEETYAIREFPDSYENTDLIYIADTYGVYEEDLPWTEGSQEDNPGPPSLIYGGFEQGEWEAVKAAVLKNQTNLIMEFNSFASPTSPDVREDITDFLNVEWTRWIGRYFNSLENTGDEIPNWIVTRYESANGEWSYEGEGFILIDDSSEDIVVLSEEEMDLNDASIRLSFTEKGQDRFGLKDSPAYPYWFDILNADNDEDILAHYEWNLTEQGQEKIDNANLPENFPAILHHKKGAAHIYYFAGDYADIADVPRYYQYKWYPSIRSLLTFESNDPENAFFWKTYHPIIQVILDQMSEQSTEDSVND